jgi:hypothetical protein
MTEREKMREEFQVSMFGKQKGQKDVRENESSSVVGYTGSKVDLKNLKYSTLPPINGQVIAEETNGRTEQESLASSLISSHNREDVEAEDAKSQSEVSDLESSSSAITKSSSSDGGTTSRMAHQNGPSSSKKKKRTFSKARRMSISSGTIYSGMFACL